MAVEVNNAKRKRKSTENEEDGETAVPKKIAKKMKSLKKQKTMTTEAQQELPAISALELQEEADAVGEDGATIEDLNQDSGFEDIRFSKDFKMLNFRAKLRGNNFITELRHFLYLARTRPKLAAKYIEKRGKPLELAESLERIDKTNVLQVAYVCEALQLVTMEIVSNQKQLMESAVYACRYFLKSHGGVLDLLLQSVQRQHRCIALKLLTAFVCVDPLLGRQLLSSYDILSNVKTIENFLSHSKFELQQEDTVRKCFIYFVLAYLVDGNTLLIRNILDRGPVIHALVSGLLYDDHVTVCVVLNTLRQYVLQNGDISKTKKIHVFDLECCKHFARLYDWYGPRVYANKYSGKQANAAKVNLSQEKLALLVDATERDTVAAAAHEFLLQLLTSRKHGITFDAITHFRQKHNVIQGKLIGFLFKPWCDERKIELVIKILHACPDLARHTVRNFAEIVNPMRTPPKNWVQAVDFLASIIGTLHPKLLRGALEQITLTDCSYWIKDICLPINTLALLTGSKMLRNANCSFRLATMRLLLAMYKQYSNYMCAIRKRELAHGDNTLRRFKFDILNHVLVNFPTIEAILYSLYMTTQASEGDEVVLAHLEVTLDLVLVICKENRSFVNKTSTILDYLKLLRPLYSNEKDPAAEQSHIKLELKAVKTIMLLFPKALEPHEELFKSVLNSFIKAFVYGKPDVQREAGVLLRGIFRNSGLFDSCELEIDLWLEPLRFVDADTLNVVTQVFIEVLQVTKAEVDTPKTAETISNKQTLLRLFENIENGLSVHAPLETLAVSKLLLLICKGVDIVPSLEKYLETVCMLMYHYYPMPEYVLQLYTMEFSSLKPYMNSWLAAKPTAHQTLSGEISQSIPHLPEVQLAILDGKRTFEDIFAKAAANEDKIELKLNGKMLQFKSLLGNTRLLLFYMQQVLFVVAQLVEQCSLQRAQAERAAVFLNNSLQIMRQLEEAAHDEDESVTLQTADAEESVQAHVSLLCQTLKYIFSVRLTYIRNAELFSAVDESHLNYVHFLCTLTAQCNAIPQFDDYTSNYRLKLVKAVAISLQSVEQTRAQSEQLRECIKLVEAFRLSAENCQEVLDLLSTSQLKYSDFFTIGSAQKSFYYELLVCIMQRLTNVQCSMHCDAFLRWFAKLYTSCVSKLGAEVNLELLEEAFHDLLLISHQLIPQLDVQFFECMFVERKLSKSTIKLACLLLQRDEKLHVPFVELLAAHTQQKELIYPLLDVAFCKQLPLEEALLQRIYQVFKSGFMKSIEKPQKAAVIYREHVQCSVELVSRCMPRSECVDFCKKNFKFDSIETYQMHLVHAIYKKALGVLEPEAHAQHSTICVNFIQLLVQMLAVELKKQNALDMQKLELFAYFFQNWWQQYTPEAAEQDYTKILQSKNWFDFCKACLRLGMQLPELDTERSEVDAKHGLLLQLLAFICQQIYTDYSTEKHTPADHDVPAQLFDMIFTHSKFYDIVLQQPHEQSTQVKTAVLQLLYTLALKCPTALQHTQIPTVLGAYQAKLSAADRYALALLQLYELHDCGLQQYRPLIWGESAVSFYALRASEEERTKLTQQETFIAQVMSLIDRQVCEYTIEHFPIWRKLQTLQQLPVVEFPNPELKARTFGTNALERRIELAGNIFPSFDTAELRLCPQRDGTFEQCYDPAFFVPLMCLCFAPEAYTHAARPLQNGLLALTFAALSSQDKDMRLAAGNAQLRYRAHFEQSKFFERPLWIQTYENIQAGLNDLRVAWMQHKRNSGTPRVPYISGLFVAKTFNLTTEPTHVLYKQLTMYLRLKSSFNFQCVPEFNVLFYSPEVEHNAFRQFIVDVIRNGVKCSSDLFLLLSTNTFKVLLSFYGSTMSTLELNLHILGVFSTCVKIPASTKIMIEQVGVLPWLSSIISGLEFHQFDIIEGLISILSNLWYALRANAQEFHNYAHLSLDIHRLVLLLLPHMSARISAANFARLLNVLNKTAVLPHHLAISEVQLVHLIDCAQKHYGAALLHGIKHLKVYGGAGAAAHFDYCQQLREQQPQLESAAILALSSLRRYTIDWWQCRHERAEVPMK